MSCYIKDSKVRERLLAYAKETRAHEFKRVGKEVFRRLDRKVEAWIQEAVHAQPSKGKTIR